MYYAALITRAKTALKIVDLEEYSEATHHRYSGSAVLSRATLTTLLLFIPYHTDYTSWRVSL